MRNVGGRHDTMRLTPTHHKVFKTLEGSVEVLPTAQYTGSEGAQLWVCFNKPNKINGGEDGQSDCRHLEPIRPILLIIICLEWAGQDMAEITSYRNAIYQGGWAENRLRHGFGILLTDQSEVLLAFWRYGSVDGLYCYLGRDCNAYGTMKEGKLHGFNVIESEESTVYGRFQDNQLHGTEVFRYPQLIEIIEYSRGELIAVKKSEEFSRELFLNILGKQFPDQLIGLIEFLSHLTSQAELIEHMQFREIRTQTAFKYYGFVEGKLREGLGIKFRNESLLSCGYYRNGELYGLGRLYCNNNQIQDGYFSQGIELEEGVVFTNKSNKYRIVRDWGRESKMQLGNPLRSVKNLRAVAHLQATNFVDGYALIDRLVRVKTDNIAKSNKSVVSFRAKSPTKQERDSSPKKMPRLLGSRRSLAERLAKISQQAELIAKQQKEALNDDSIGSSEMEDLFGDPAATNQQLLNILETTSQKTAPQKQLSKSSSAASPLVRARSPTEFPKK